MAALVCDICGGKLVMGAGGIAVCDSCGMEHSKDRMQEKVQEIKGTVRVDNSHMVDNYLQIAQNAVASGNNAEGEKYCNQVLEIDPQNYTAWVLKGETAGRQSTVANDRILEASRCFLYALKYAPTEEKSAIVVKTCDKVRNLCTALVVVCCKNCTRYLNQENVVTLINKTDDAITFAKAYTSDDSVKAFREFDIEALKENSGDEDKSKNEITTQLATVASIQWLENIGGNLAEILNSVFTNTWQTVWSEYQGDKGRPSDGDLDRFLKRYEMLRIILRKSIEIEISNKDKIRWYMNFITILEAVRDCKSWEKKFFPDGYEWQESKSVSEQTKELLQGEINRSQNEIRKLEAKLDKEFADRVAEEEQKKEKARQKYWAEHAEEKKMLETEGQSLEEQIAALNSEISNIPGRIEKEKLEERIRRLEAEKEETSFFKRKEKKAIQEQIDATSAELDQVSMRVDAAYDEIQKKIAPLMKRKIEIYAELKKDR